MLLREEQPLAIDEKKLIGWA